MFTGLVEEVGTIAKITEENGGRRFTIRAQQVLSDVAEGSSIAVNGVCLTVENFTSSQFQIFAVPETLAVTNIRDLKEGSRVNLERALSAHDRMGGHIVQGHVESQAEVTGIRKEENYWELELNYHSPYLIPKGSIALDGISLTLHVVEGDRFRIQIIPETLKKTNIPDWFVGYRVNVETDYLVKAIDHIIRWRQENQA